MRGEGASLNEIAECGLWIGERTAEGESLFWSISGPAKGSEPWCVAPVLEGNIPFPMRPLFPLFATLAVAPLFAEVKPAPYFADAMVIQRDAPVVVRGTADAGESVTVTFAGSSATVRADAKGAWAVKLPAKPANAKGGDLVIKGAKNTVTLTDVLVGDVWVSAGQSNMEWTLARDKDGRAALASAGDDGLRLLTYEKPGSDVGSKALGKDANKRLYPEHYYTGAWARDGKKSAGASSAVAYWFGKKLRAETGVPIGLVGYAIGGAPLESFFPVDGLKKRYPKKLQGDWMKNPELPKWCSGRAAQNLAKVEDAPADALGKNHGYKPGFAWEAGMGRIAGIPVRGFLWYQGESNAIEPARVKEFPALQAAMVAEWRERWGDPKLPFYFVQLSACEGGDRLHWGEFRDNQRLGVALIPPPAGMAVSYDFGPSSKGRSDVHPTEKKPIGERLARLALHDVYGKKDVVVSGPAPLKASAKGAELVVTFDSAKGLKASSGDALTGFEVAGADGKFVPAEAKVVGETVVVSSKGVGSPKTVRYAWASWCKESNLVNGEGLPASTFSLSVR